MYSDLAAPDGLHLRLRGAGGSEPVLLDENYDSSAFSGYAVRFI